jgi:hypothetical protein
MSPTDMPALIAAQRFYGTHRGEHLAHDVQRLVDRCAAHLADVYGLAPAGARELAAVAHEQLERGTVTAVVDVGGCSTEVVVVRDLADGSAHVLAAGELLQLARSRQPPVPPPDAAALAG